MNATNKTNEDRQPSRKIVPIYIALLPAAVLIVLLSLNVYIFGDDAVSGSNQIILMLCGAFCACLALFHGVTWKALELSIAQSIRLVSPAVIILLMVGALSGTWLVSGVIPTMIYYGLYVLSPDFFLVSACIICIVVSIFTGSSWTTSATIGIAMMGIGSVLGVNPAYTAGAILSGAYFGDKISPLSDTTNLASATAGVDLFTHIRYMMITTVPSILIALILFTVIGFFSGESTAITNKAEIQGALRGALNISPWLLLVPAAVLAMILKKIPAIPATFFGALLGAAFALIFQRDLVRGLGDGGDHSLYVGLMRAAYSDTSVATGNAVMDELLSAGGMGGMLGTVWLIVAAMVFGGIMEGSGFLARITQTLISKAKSIFGLVSATVGTCIFTNVSASDQYLAVVVPGRMFSSAFKQQGLAPQNLSRTVEDSGTVTSVLIPWNTCGAYHATVLGVATLQYLPFVFFCLLSPVMTLLVAAFRYKIARLNDSETQRRTDVREAANHAKPA
ncbi:Na(+)/H(+) antiporter NhaC [Thalassocella blandensis]|nr:Na(+)/H(+) antiporter NhaC [Thalassocella blandensis]